MTVLTCSKSIEQGSGQLWQPFAVCAVLGIDKSFRLSIAGLAFIVHAKLRGCTCLEVARFHGYLENAKIFVDYPCGTVRCQRGADRPR